MTKKWIKLFDPIIGSEEEKAVLKTLKSHFWASGSGSGQVTEFEKKFTQYLNSKNCVAVNSGTAALHLALSIMDIKNKEVILPSLSFASTAHAVKYNGGIPIFVDIREDDLNMDIELIESFISKKTKVILPVHFAGLPSNLSKIKTICKKHNLLLVEDAAHAAGAKFQNKKIGSTGDAVCFSFHPVKNLAMPTGGAISLNGKNIKTNSNLLKTLRWCGISDRNGPFYDVSEIGWNYYMNEFSASIGLIQLKKLDKNNQIRKNIAKRYQNEIKTELKMPYDSNCSYHFYWIRVKDQKHFIKKINQEKIEVGTHYSPIHKMKIYNSKQKLKNTEKISNEIITLPTHPNLSENDLSRIISTVNKLLN